jgi:hypothetical protein
LVVVDDEPDLRKLVSGFLTRKSRLASASVGCVLMMSSREALFAVVQPVAAEAALAAEAQARAQRDQVRDVLGRDLEAARFAADRAFRQYDVAVGPVCFASLAQDLKSVPDYA